MGDAKMDDALITLLRLIALHGGRKYTSGNVDRSAYQILVNLGLLTAHATKVSDVEYEVTKKGR